MFGKTITISLLLSLLVLQANAKAPVDPKDFRHHVIVLIDRSGSIDQVSSEEEIRKMFANHLEAVCFEESRVITGRKLLQPGDFVSLLGFGLEKRDPQAARFIHTADSREGTFGFKYKADFSQGFFRNFHQHWVKDRNFFRMHFSGISLAKLSALDDLKDTSRKVDKTFIIFISDNAFNGPKNNPNDELDGIAVIDFELEDGRAMGGWSKNRLRDGLEKKLSLFNSFQSYYQQETNKYVDKNVGNRYDNKIKLSILEYIPANYDVNQSLNIGSEFLFERKKDSYDYEFKLKVNVPDSIYHIDSLTAVIVDTVSNTLIANGSVAGGNLEFSLPRKTYRLGDRLRADLQFWVHQQDPFYGIHRLRPDMEVDQLRKGLNKSVRVRFEEKSGILTLGRFGEFLFNITRPVVGDDEDTNLGVWVFLAFLIASIAFYIFVRIKGVIKDPASVEFTSKNNIKEA